MPDWSQLDTHPDRHAALLAHSGEAHELPPSSRLSILVPNPAVRTSNSDVICRVADKGLPKQGSFVVLNRPGFESVIAESPALTVVRVAEKLLRCAREDSLSETAAMFRLTAILDEFCGRYVLNAVDPRNGPAIYDAEPILDFEQLTRFLRTAQHLRGSGLTKRCLSLGLDNLGSPMEVLLELLLCAPANLGGLSLPKPLSNEPLRFGSRQQALVFHNRLRPDLYWPEWKIALEYNGHDHDDPDVKDEDDRRISDYQACGITVFPVRFTEVVDTESLDRLLKRIIGAASKTMGTSWAYRKRVKLFTPQYQQARKILLDAMLPCKME